MLSLEKYSINTDNFWLTKHAQQNRIFLQQNNDNRTLFTNMHGVPQNNRKNQQTHVVHVGKVAAVGAVLVEICFVCTF